MADSKISELTSGVPTDTDIIPFVDLATGTTKKAVKTDLIGPQGYQGPQGVTGPQGFQGYQGSQGVQGPQGPQGLQGYQGIIGTQGSQGFQGSQGSQGFQGPQGSPNGPQGTQGFQGPQGAQGFQGIIGTQGTQGFQGPQGIQGRTGSQGSQGYQGPQGGTIKSSVSKIVFNDPNATGSIAYTGAGFTPSLVIIHGIEAAAAGGWSYGVATDSASMACDYMPGGSDQTPAQTTDYIIYLVHGASNTYATYVSASSDGFTLNWSSYALDSSFIATCYK